MNKHVEPIRTVLSRFVEENAGAPAIVRGSDRVIVRGSGLGENIHASIHIPAFDNMSLFERQRLVWDFLKMELAPEHRAHLVRLDTLTSEEWDEQAGVPPGSR